MPELKGVANATVTVFGAGCIGAPSVLEFARMGIKELRIVEPDYVDPGTIRRWPYGIRHAGQLKVRVLNEILANEYPYTAVKILPLRVGVPRQPSEPPHYEMLNRMLDGISLVYDATADWAVQRFLSDEARTRLIPYIGVSGTEGGWGGTILRLWPDDDAPCWLCWRLNSSLPQPAAMPSAAVQPQGCGDKTFTAAGFDMVEIATHGVRLAASTLSPGGAGDYPKAEFDLEVIDFRGAGGASLVPTVRTSLLEIHPDCPVCVGRQLVSRE